MATPVIIEIRANARQAIRELNMVSGTLSRFGGQVRGVAGLASQSVTGIRQMAQGVQNLGFVLSAFISLPVMKAMKGIADQALTFERAMVEVQKTTGLANEPIAKLSDNIRELSKQTPTTAIELANIASEAGRAGVGLGNILAGNVEAATKEIMEFTRIVDMMAISTTLGFEEAAIAFGRFMTIFDDLDTTNIENLGSAINELGQAFSINEEQIVSAMMRSASALEDLGVAPEIAAAYAAVLTQVSESASRAGTRLRRAFEQLSENYKVIADFLDIDAAKFKKMIGEDAAGAFLKVVWAVSQIIDPVDRSNTAIQLFGSVGAQAVKRLAGVYPDLIRGINISTAAFDEGTSLQTEFNRAINATVELLNILKNNLIDVGAGFMKDLLPMAKEIIGALIPAVQQLGAYVAALPVKTKLLIVAFGALLIVGLPLLALIGSFGFAISMFVSGLINLVTGIFGLVISLGALLTSGSLVTVGILALAAAIGVALVAGIGKATGTFDAIIDKLKDIAEQASAWGENIVAEIAGGIISAAANILIDALNFVGDIISSFLEGHSAPSVGPLSTMGGWGKALMETFLSSFKDADFSILKTVTGIVKRFFQAMVDAGEMAAKKVGPALLRIRELLARLIHTFNLTGEISASVLSQIARAAGEIGGELAKLIRLQLEYNRALRELEAIRLRQTDIKEGYEAEVRAIQNRTDLTIAEKMALIRQAREKKNLLVDNAKTEESAAKRNVDGLKTQLDWQKQYLDALVEQKSIWADAVAAMKKAASAMSSLGKAIRNVLADLLQKLDINKKMQAEYKKAGIDTKGLLREELSLRKRIVAELLKIEDPTEDQKKLLADNLARIKEIDEILGAEAAYGWPPIDTSEGDDALAEFKENLDEIIESVKSFRDIFSEGSRNFAAFMAGLGGDVDFPETAFMEGSALSESERKFYGWGTTVYNALENFRLKIEGVKTAWQGFLDMFGGAEEEGEGQESVFGKIGTAVDDMGLLVIPALLGIFFAARILGPVLIGLGSKGALGLLSLGSAAATSGIGLGTFIVVGGAAALIALALVGTIAELATNWEKYEGRVNDALDKIADGFAGFKQNIVNALQAVPGGEDIDWETIVGALGKIFEIMADLAVTEFELVANYMSKYLPMMGNVIGRVFGGLKTAVGGGIKVFEGVIDVIAGLIDLLKGGEGEKVGEGLKKIDEGLFQLLSGLAAWGLGLVGGALEWVEAIVTTIIDTFIDPSETTLAIKNWFRAATTAIDQGFKDLVSGDWIETFTDGWNDTIDGIAEALPGIIQGILEDLEQALNNLLIRKGGEEGGLFSGIGAELEGAVPVWASTLGTGLSGLTAVISTWNVAEAIPAIQRFIAGGDIEFQQVGSKWNGTLVGQLSILASTLSTWVINDAIPALGTLISSGLETLGRIGTEWVAEAETQLSIVKEKFQEIFDDIGDIIEEAIKAAMNSAIGSIQKGVNIVINGINKLIKAVNKIATAVGLDAIDLIEHISLPTLAKGGVALKPMIAMIGDVPEAIIPLSKLDSILGADQKGNAEPLIININNPVVRNDDDLKQMIDTIERQLGLKLNAKYDLLGRGIGY